ncbi:MAG: outer membrane protein [Acidobacteriota bacterium]
MATLLRPCSRGRSCACSSDLARAALLAASMLVATPGRAEADWFVTPYLGVKFAADTNFVDLEQGANNTKLAVGAALGWLAEGPLGIEADVGYYPRFFERSSGSLVARSQVVTLMGSVILAVPRSLTRDSLRPFLSGGAGLMHVGIDDVASVFPVDSNLFAVNVGGGAVGALTNRTSVRFDLRYFKSVSTEETPRVGFGSTRLSFWRAAIGVTLQ